MGVLFLSLSLGLHSSHCSALDNNPSHKYSVFKKALTPQTIVDFHSSVGTRDNEPYRYSGLKNTAKGALGYRPVGRGDVISLTSKLPSDLTQP